MHGASELRGFGGFSLYLGGNDCVDVTTKRLENGTFALMQQKITAGTIKYDGTRLKLASTPLQSHLRWAAPARPAGMLGRNGWCSGAGRDCDINEDCAGSAICQSSAGTCPAKCVAL